MILIRVTDFFNLKDLQVVGPFKGPLWPRVHPFLCIFSSNSLWLT